uniref:Glycosyltransferase n=1 Tax=viral metagenome TaxID=1070528 RepID=A0A6M3JS18_9ZZZZ
MSKKKQQTISGHPVASRNFTKRVLIGIPMTGLLRAEWHLAYMGMVVPCNWSQSTFAHVFNPYSPLRFLVADARNLVVQKAVLDGFEWVIFIDHDVVLPNNVMIKFNERMIKEDIPITGGLYFTKSVPAEPLVYRGRGNGYFNKWKLGEKVWVDGMGLGCHLIHVPLLKTIYEDSETYSLQPGVTVRRVFETPSRIEIDPDSGGIINGRGTEDLPFYSRLMEGGYLKKAGWGEFQKKKFPYLCDTSIFCHHIDNNGIRYPSRGEEREFK